jgi:large subunit ribosomal protein L25
MVFFVGMKTAVTVVNRDDKSVLDKSLNIAGVVYGPTQSPLPISVNRKDFEKVFKVAGESTVLTLTGLDKSLEVLIKAVEFAPIKGGIQHVDFYAVDAAHEVTTHVPLVFIGEAPVVKQGAIVNKVLHEVEVVCLAKDLPNHLDVDLSTLEELEDKILVSDITLPKGVKVQQDMGDTVAIAEPAANPNESEETTTVDMSAIEVEKKGEAEA